MAAAKEKIIGTCQLCGKEFVKTKRNQKFCSSECALIQSRERQRVNYARRQQIARVKQSGNRESLARFDARAKAQHLTYGQLQALETMARLKDAEGSRPRKEGTR